MTNWNKIFSTGTLARDIIEEFAEGKLSGEKTQQCFRNTYSDASGELRKLIREHGTLKARKIARKALKRRNLI